MIFEPSWESRDIPAEGKLAKVLIFKKGNKEESGNYKPVNLSSVSGKIREKVIVGGIVKHMKNNAVIGHSQHGFMTGQSCLSNLQGNTAT